MRMARCLTIKFRKPYTLEKLQLWNASCVKIYHIRDQANNKFFQDCLITTLGLSNISWIRLVKQLGSLKSSANKEKDILLIDSQQMAVIYT